MRGQASVTPIRFLLGLPFDVAFLPYWYLYSYLGILVSLPFLRPLAQNMPKNAFWYLIALQIVTESLQITLGFSDTIRSAVISAWREYCRRLCFIR